MRSSAFMWLAVSPSDIDTEQNVWILKKWGTRHHAELTKEVQRASFRSLGPLSSMKNMKQLRWWRSRDGIYNEDFWRKLLKCCRHPFFHLCQGVILSPSNTKSVGAGTRISSYSNQTTRSHSQTDRTRIQKPWTERNYCVRLMECGLHGGGDEHGSTCGKQGVHGNLGSNRDRPRQSMAT